MKWMVKGYKTDWGKEKILRSFPGCSAGKESACNSGDPGLVPGLGRSPGKEQQPTSVFLPGKSCRQRSLAGYSPWGHKESDMTEWFHFPKDPKEG